MRYQREGENNKSMNDKFTKLRRGFGMFLKQFLYHCGLKSNKMSSEKI